MNAASRPLQESLRVEIRKVAGRLGLGGHGSTTGARIIAVLCNPGAMAAQVSTLITQDPSLCARVLKIANSPFYGRSRSITTIDKALVLLGLDAVRGIAAAACLDRTMKRRVRDGGLDLQAVLHHSLATAVAAESLAGMRQPSLAADAFTAGLLHHLGIVIQFDLSAKGLGDMVTARNQGDTRPIRELEIQAGIVGHEEFAALLFEEWQLPAAFISAARHHHDPAGAEASHRTLAALVGTASNLAISAGYAFSLEPHGRTDEQMPEGTLHFEPAEIEAVIAALPDKVQALVGSLA